MPSPSVSIEDILLLAIVVIVVVGFALFITRHSRARSRAKKGVLASGGLMDEPAQEALRNLNNADNLTAGDLFRRANLMRFNMLEDNLHQHPEIVNRVATDYMNALNQLPNDITEDDLATDFILRTIVDFTDRGVVNNEFANIAHNTANLVGRQTTATKIKAAKSKKTTRKAAVDEYLDRAQTHTNDPQNVHESKVNESLRSTLATIRCSNPDTTRALREAESMVSRLPEHKRKRAEVILRKFAEGSRIDALNDNESNIFAYVWERSNLPENKKNKNLMREAVMDALVDATDANGNPVCVNGRCARVIGSLALLDHQDDVGKVMTFEAYKNQIFEETKDIVDHALDRYANGNEHQQAFARSYAELPPTADATTDKSEIAPEIPAHVEEAFFETVRTDVDNVLGQYSDKLSPQELGTVREGVLAFMGI